MLCCTSLSILNEKPRMVNKFQSFVSSYLYRMVIIYVDDRHDGHLTPNVIHHQNVIAPMVLLVEYVPHIKLYGLYQSVWFI